MDLLLGFISGQFSKVAIFLLLFAAAAIIFEIFYFRRRREHELTTQIPQVSSEPITKSLGSKRKTVLIILGMLLVLVLLPASVYVVFQRVNVEKQAQAPPGQGALTIVCDQVDIVSGQRVVEPASLALNDSVSFVGYCYITSADQTISKLRFVLTTPTGQASPVEFLAFAAPTKNRENRHYYQATYPNVRISEIGSYRVDLWGFNNQLGLTREPFNRSFSIAASGVRATPTPTLTQGQQAGNQPPTCNSLSAIPLTGPAPLTVSFTGIGADSDGQVVAFEFTYGDGTKETVNKGGSVTSSHVYQAAGSYTASLRVQDNSRAFSAPSSLCRVTINVAAGIGSGTSSAQLKAQPTRTATPTPTKVALPEAGVGLPMVGFVTAGLVMLTFGLLLAF